jgi:hypothetical protein
VNVHYYEQGNVGLPCFLRVEHPRSQLLSGTIGYKFPLAGYYGFLELAEDLRICNKTRVLGLRLSAWIAGDCDQSRFLFRVDVLS